MTGQKKVKYLKIDRGRYFYQRRVPDRFQRHLGLKKWLIACGNVDYPKAVQMVVTWAEEHDQLIADLKNPETLRKAKVETVRRAVAQSKKSSEDLGIDTWYEMTEQREGEKKRYRREALPRPWQAAAKMLNDADASFAGKPDLSNAIADIDFWVAEAQRGDPPTRVQEFPDYEEIVRHLAQYDASVIKAARITIVDKGPGLQPENYLDWLQTAYEIGFGPDRKPPDDPDDKDEFEFIKRKLERKISGLMPDPSTLSAVMQKYCDFNSIRPGTRSKYRRDLARLIEITGDVPISHVRTDDLRRLRDDLIGRVKPASLQAIFTPIKGIFSFAFDEDIIGSNPMMAVKLPPDKRPIEERKWKSFDPSEVSRILTTAETEWGDQARGLTKERSEAILMVVRVLAFTGMRPIEVIRLTPDDIDDRLIRIRGSKTESSTRVVPLHPVLAEFPAWVAAGGLTTFQTIKTDPVGSVRHNFGRLIRAKMNPPIKDSQKALYSLRSTFVNAMRRAGADIQVQRAILGHKEAGAIRHYDDGPEFAVKKKWVEATDPRR
ncbi:tyrosine-type recombinase/integrase [uncultured Roseobacter sp.]|uniref:tyrosine-type recombinase/integrase n=1 Tax=uncultured Roseobacter sp. TaxID=114847 RepID=UPI0026392BB0|nr:tyrosine-type recombinase/integrase [uncultured Roseobacter sp.]